MVDVNRITLCGNLTKDPTYKNVGQNSVVCQFRIAVNRTWFSKDGQRQKKTCYVDIESWNNIATKCKGILTKGSPVFIDGTLEYDSWVDRATNSTNSRHYVKAQIINFFGDPRGLKTELDREKNTDYQNKNEF